MTHHANHVRSNTDDLKIGGHQASSTSMVSILTALYFHYLDAGDRVSVKPHASPAYHAIQYLLGNLDQSYLRTLRAFNGLNEQPSHQKSERTKVNSSLLFDRSFLGFGMILYLMKKERNFQEGSLGKEEHRWRGLTLSVT